MKIYLIRHGETTGDIENRYGGDYDDHLSKRGKKQSAARAEKLKGKEIEKIFHSPRIRATESAQIIGKVIGAKLQRVEGLKERNNYGIMTGMVKSEALEKFPSEVDKLKRNPIHHDISGSESYGQFSKRVVDAFERIVDDDSFNTIAIVSHGGPIKCIVRELLRLGELDSLEDCAVIYLEKRGTCLEWVSADGASLKK